MKNEQIGYAVKKYLKWGRKENNQWFTSAELWTILGAIGKNIVLPPHTQLGAYLTNNNFTKKKMCRDDDVEHGDYSPQVNMWLVDFWDEKYQTCAKNYLSQRTKIYNKDVELIKRCFE
jgi:hypothetical protein